MRGYQRKPLPLILIAIGFLLIPAVTAVQFYFQGEGSWRFLSEILTSGFFLEEWLFSWSAAAAVFIVSRGSLAYLIVLSGYVLTRRLTSWAAYPTLESPLSVGITCFWFGVVIAFLISELKTPYLHPRLRWWTRPRRLGISGEAALFYEENRIPVELLNISQGGAFIRLPEGGVTGPLFPQRLGEQFQFEMTLGDKPLFVFQSKVRLVWKGLPESPYRLGIGIQFLELSRQQRRLLKKHLQREA